MNKKLKYKQYILSLFTKEHSLWIFVFSLFAIFFVHNDHRHDSVLNWDVFGYYLYLPALFIHQDLYLQQYEWVAELFQQYEISTTFYQAIKWESGNWIIRYTPGMSVLYLPFFLIGHLAAGILGMPQDGLSAPYQYAIDYGMLLYPSIGLWYIRKWLRRYFNDEVTAFSLLILVFGTNFLHIAGDNPGLTHAPLFSLYAIFLYEVDRYFSDKSIGRLYAVAAVAGLIILIRPTEAVLLMLPLLWNITFAGLRNLWGEIKSRIFIFLKPALLVLAVVFPMMLYWKLGVGNWLINSYRNPGEGLDFLDPHFRLFLLSFRKGWLIYTPLAFLMISGLWMMARKKEGPYASIGIFFLLSLYVSASWTCWWYAGGCYSQRNMVQIYAALSLPLAYAVQSISKRKPLLKVFMAIGITGLMGLNLFQHWQFKHDIIDHERMTGEAYKKAFLKTSRNSDLEASLLIDRSTDEDEFKHSLSDYLIIPLFDKNFPYQEIDLKYGIQEGQTSGYVGGDKEFLDMFTGPINQITGKYYFWVRVSAMVYIPEQYTGDSPGIVVHFENKEGAYKYRHKLLGNEKLKKGAWNELSIDYLSPEARSDKDRLKIYLWHPSKEKVRVNQLRIYMLEPKKENPIP